jgi:hypothetical protein
MNAHKRVLLALLAIVLSLAAALPALAQDPMAEDPVAEDSTAANPRPDLLRFRGTVTAIQGAVFALRTPEGALRFQTNERTRFRVPGVENPTLADVRVGDLADVAAVRRPAGGLLAMLVAVRPERVRLDGDVTQIAGNNLKIQNPGGEVLIHTDENTRFRVPGVENPTLADIQVGDHIHGFAVKQGEGSLWGRLIAVVDEYKLRGQVTAVEGSAITIQRPDGSLTVVTDDHTRFRVLGVESPTLADVHVGDLVNVVAFGQGDGTILAKGVAVLKGIQFQGEVTAKDGAVLTLSTAKGPLSVMTDAGTRYRVPGVENPTLDDVHVGDQVRVNAVSQGAGGGLLAKGIAVLPPPQETL